ncbi:uncharacterized protein LOC131427075 [Malaya genurostris]|uniref:uncharacterized protein LOC131427075 n=1 Tax=Malaya genurostris TaxID=325434 RepID=UPI0026F3CECA|nr:uncharacterized protein LOC131427075 [Malaya genurostris]
MLHNTKEIVFLLLLLASRPVHPLECYRCKSTIGWSACAQAAFVEECTAEHSFRGSYQCVSNRMNMTISTLHITMHSTGCGWSGQDGAKALFRRLTAKHTHANISVEEWQTCNQDLCNVVANLTREDPVIVVAVADSSLRIQPTLVMLGVFVIAAVRMVMKQ